MHYEVRYQGTKAEKDTKAIADACDYLGIKRFDQVMGILQSGLPRKPTKNNYRGMLMGLMMTGIRGAPAYAMVRLAYRDRHDLVDRVTGLGPCDHHDESPSDSQL